MKQPNPQSKKAAPKQKAGLHHFIATGGKPKDFQGCQGVNSETVPGYREKKSEK
jgi:hypothetical protein